MDDSLAQGAHQPLAEMLSTDFQGMAKRTKDLKHDNLWANRGLGSRANWKLPVHEKCTPCQPCAKSTHDNFLARSDQAHLDGFIHGQRDGAG